MITQTELINASRTKHIDDAVLICNLKTFLERINDFRREYGRPMIPTSFYRSKDDQLNIYRDKAKKKQSPFKDGVFNAAKVPMGSAHLYCQACDFSDPKGVLQAWINKNVSVLEKCGLWCEDFGATPTWVHFQTVAPKSGKRFFKP